LESAKGKLQDSTEKGIIMKITPGNITAVPFAQYLFSATTLQYANRDVIRTKRFFHCRVDVSIMEL
jgi:hypothetical protein